MCVCFVIVSDQPDAPEGLRVIFVRGAGISENSWTAPYSYYMSKACCYCSLISKHKKTCNGIKDIM